MLLSECKCEKCGCNPFMHIGKDTGIETRRIKVSCNCKSARVEVKSGCESEVEQALEEYLATPCGVTR